MADDSSSGFPSLTALLGLLAVAGYQNRDKIGEWLSGAAQQAQQPGGAGGARAPAGMGQAGQGVGGILGGLGELVDKFTQSGQGQKADSWVRQGPNEDVAPSDLERALGPDLIAAITRQTGLSRDDLLDRLSAVVPKAVDSSTPDGMLRRG
ncbi:MAG TPA: YidB family protein [Bosea sp. (in: a-proteobacteria)]|jgi:uncharacterized protein YidB (DUF937 family)|uniref:YidB family protein n=1 Tax=Bosea sp. (in: a-proteobacteria) TaxID=1871050 RepID=UPI002E140FA5|nr:YidB family protein [Bosea sp. (in: a-proteobacteria)]